MTLKLSLTVKHNLQIFGFFQIKSLGRANSNLLYEFYKTPFCRTRFLEHEERSDECYKSNKCDKMAFKTSIIQYFFYFAP
jgi:hypothetical protein